MTKDTGVVEKPTTIETAAANGAILPAITIDAIYLLDDYLEPIAIKPVASLADSVPFDPEAFYRVYFDHSGTPRRPASMTTARTRTFSGRAMNSSALSITFAPQQPRQRLNALSWR